MRRTCLPLLLTILLIRVAPAARAEQPEQARAEAPSQSGTAVIIAADGARMEVPISYSPVAKPRAAAEAPSVAPGVPITAADLGPTQAAVRHPARKWYGGQTLLVDVASLAVVMASAEGDSGVGVALGAGGVLLGAPIVHLANGQGSFALASLAARALIPVAVLVTSCKQTPYGEPNAQGFPYGTERTCGHLDHAPLVFLWGGAFAALIESALAWKDTDSPPPPAHRAAAPARSRVSLDSAGVVPLPAGATLALAGRF